MIEYLYFVKWLDNNNIAEEVFEFFDEAKSFAMNILSQQPEIHQTEIIRNDFGECVDSNEIGKVWSWEDLMDDIPENTETDGDFHIFTRGDFDKYADGYDPDNDPEFDDRDITFETDCVLSEWVAMSSNNTQQQTNNSTDLDTLATDLRMNSRNVSGRVFVTDDYSDNDSYNYCDAVNINAKYSRDKMAYGNSFSYSSIFTNSTGKTLREIFNATGYKLSVRRIWTYNNDNNIILVNTPGFHFIIDKNDLINQINNQININSTTNTNESLNESCRKSIPEGRTIKDLVEEMEENEDIVECKWCEELFDKSECRYEVNMGWLCPQCQAAIKSRGETLTFRESANKNKKLIGKSSDSASLTEAGKIEVSKYNDYEPGKYCSFTKYGKYDQEVDYYISCDEVVDALTEIVDDEYIQFQTEETDELRTVEALRNAGKLREFFMDDLGTHISNYSDELEDYFSYEWEDEVERSDNELEAEWKNEGPGGGAFSSWTDFYRHVGAI